MSQFYDNLSDMFVSMGDDIDTDRFVACGDFNCNATVSTSIRAELITLFDMHGLKQHVSDATRTTSTTFSLLDLVICGADSSRVSKVAVQPMHGVRRGLLPPIQSAFDRC